MNSNSNNLHNSILDIDNQELESLNHQYQKLSDIIRQREEDVIKSALRSFLGHEPTIEDAKRCAKVYMPNTMDGYCLTYDGQEVGTFTWSYHYADLTAKATCTFKPVK